MIKSFVERSDQIYDICKTVKLEIETDTITRVTDHIHEANDIPRNTKIIFQEKSA